MKRTLGDDIAMQSKRRRIENDIDTLDSIKSMGDIEISHSHYISPKGTSSTLVKSKESDNLPLDTPISQYQEDVYELHGNDTEMNQDLDQRDLEEIIVQDIPENDLDTLNQFENIDDMNKNIQFLLENSQQQQIMTEEVLQRVYPTRYESNLDKNIENDIELEMDLGNSNVNSLENNDMQNNLENNLDIFGNEYNLENDPSNVGNPEDGNVNAYETMTGLTPYEKDVDILENVDNIEKLDDIRQEYEVDTESREQFNNDDLVQYEANEIFVPGEEKASKRRFDMELNEMIDPFSMREEREGGRFSEETGMWTREKHNVRDNWLEDAIENMESGKFNPNDYRKFEEANKNELNPLEFSRYQDKIEKESLLVIIRTMKLVLYAIETEDWNMSLKDIIDEMQEHEIESISESELALAIGRLTSIEYYDAIDLYTQTLAFFNERMERFREVGVKWEYKWNLEDETIYGPFTTYEMCSWMYAKYFVGQSVYVRKAQNANDDMFGDSEDTNNELFIPIEEVEFELYS